MIPIVRRDPVKLQTRPAEMTDLADLAALEDGTRDAADLPRLRQWYDYSRCVRYRCGIRRWCVMRVAVDVAGLVLGHVVLAGDDRRARLERIVVHPQYRRAQVGTRLLTDALDEARDRHRLAQVACLVRERHDEAIAFAVASGFRPRPVKPVVREFFGAEDAYCLVLDLEAPRDV